MTAHDAPEPDETSATPETPKRLVVELGRRANADLLWAVDEVESNKTTVVNRALQVYRLILEAQANGGTVTVDDPKRGNLVLHVIA